MIDMVDHGVGHTEATSSHRDPATVWSTDQYLMRLSNQDSSSLTDPLSQFFGRDIGFVPAAICLSGFPLVDNQPYETFSRVSENMAISLQPHTKLVSDRMFRFKVPYGSIPRLLMVWISTQLHKPGRADDDFGLEIGNIKDWFGQMKLSFAGGRSAAVKDQLVRLANCIFHFSCRFEQKEAFRPEDLFQISITSDESMAHYMKAQDIFDTFGRSPEWREAMSKVRWPVSLIMKDSMARLLKNYAVPLPPERLALVAESPFAMDILFFMCFTIPRIDPGEKLFLSWGAIAKRFGSNRAVSKGGLIETLSPAKFRDRFRPSIERALSVYSEANAELREDGLLLRHSDPISLSAPLRNIVPVIRPPELIKPRSIKSASPDPRQASFL